MNVVLWRNLESHRFFFQVVWVVVLDFRVLFYCFKETNFHVPWRIWWRHYRRLQKLFLQVGWDTAHKFVALGCPVGGPPNESTSQLVLEAGFWVWLISSKKLFFFWLFQSTCRWILAYLWGQLMLKWCCMLNSFNFERLDLHINSCCFLQTKGKLKNILQE